MARIAGVDIPADKRAVISLTYIYGIGDYRSQEILKTADIDPNKRVKELSEEEVIRLREIIDKNYRIEGDLRREVGLNIKRLQEGSMLSCLDIILQHFFFKKIFLSLIPGQGRLLQYSHVSLASSPPSQGA